jgi:CHAD domain-containing protein
MMAGELENIERALRDLGKSLKNLPRNPQPEQVHKLRTSARRVEAIASALPPADGKQSRRLVKSIAPLRKAAGHVRDMDVLAASIRRLSHEAPGDSLARLAGHFRAARAEEAGELHRAFKHKGKEARHKLKEYAQRVESALVNGNTARNGHGRNGSYQTSIHPTAKHVARTLAEWPELNSGNIHDFRLKVKQLRYILQLDPKADLEFLESLGKTQRRIGEWHDWAQLAEVARESLNSQKDHALLARINEIEQQKLGRALGQSNSLRRHHLPSSAVHVLGC